MKSVLCRGVNIGFPYDFPLKIVTTHPDSAIQTVSYTTMSGKCQCGKTVQLTFVR